MITISNVDLGFGNSGSNIRLTIRYTFQSDDFDIGKHLVAGIAVFGVDEPAPGAMMSSSDSLRLLFEDEHHHSFKIEHSGNRSIQIHLDVDKNVLDEDPMKVWSYIDPYGCPQQIKMPMPDEIVVQVSLQEPSCSTMSDIVKIYA